jgi:hypothetical protein
MPSPRPVLIQYLFYIKLPIIGQVIRDNIFLGSHMLYIVSAAIWA